MRRFLREKQWERHTNGYRAPREILVVDRRMKYDYNRIKALQKGWERIS